MDNHIHNIANNGMLFGMSTDSIIRQIENYTEEIRKYSDTQLELEIKAQVDARSQARHAIEDLSPDNVEPYQLDLTLILFRLTACAEESKRRFIP